MIPAPDRVVNAPEREHWDDHKNSRDALDVLVISSRPFRSDLSIEFKSRILVDENFELGRAFAANGTPSAVLVGPDGIKYRDSLPPTVTSPAIKARAQAS